MRSSFKNFIDKFDSKYMNFLNGSGKDCLLYKVMKSISIMFDARYAAVLFSIFVVSLDYFNRGFKRPIMLLAISQLITHTLKRIFMRNRPFVKFDFVNLIISKPKDEFSFPSGHTAMAFSMAFAIKMSFPFLFIPALCLATLCGISRIYLGVHYPTDVIIGALIPTIVYFMM